ncbi:MAG: glutamate synthase subunit beta [Deferribacteraceae bacterium]|jgi:glutamate synthase (NADPH/NADH) small chain|nr:glutamate synthase subunit beta [Deferribacteraceae bacterium]
MSFYRSVAERVNDYEEVELSIPIEEFSPYAQYCRSCGIPFCYGIGCPLGNLIPDIIAFAKAGRWDRAWALLSSTSCFPEFTSKICPALCENACSNNVSNYPVSIRLIEKMVVDKAFELGYVKPFIPAKRSGRTVAVIGAGPAGLTIAEKLNRYGHLVTVFEKSAYPGGLMRYGIPNFKLDKKTIDRRIEVMSASEINFVCSEEAGVDVSPAFLMRNYDAVALAIGAPIPRDIKAPGRELSGIHYALDFLSSQNRVVAGEVDALEISAEGKDVVVIGSGDTGSDCVGTSVRQRAKSILQIDIMPAPPAQTPTVWPDWPYKYTTSSSQEEGGSRLWGKLTKAFEGENGVIKRIKTIDLEWSYGANGKPASFKEIPNSESYINADLVLLAMGFLGVAKTPFIEGFGLSVSERGMIGDNPPAFSAGDCRTGQSLVVRAMADAHNVSGKVHEYLISLKK